jgi:Raf kinase inhibitor-like YbhB/YbcL family protein
MEESPETTAMKLAGYALCAVLIAGPAAAMGLTSPDIRNGAPIPIEQVYTRCGGQNVSPALAWSGVPAGTKSFAITAIDHNVPPNDWSHWIVIDIPPGTTSLAKGASLPAGAHAMMTDFGDAGYGGPCPPQGSGAHHYEFTVWALHTATPQLPAHANAKEIAAALQRDALAKASITGTYQR